MFGMHIYGKYFSGSYNSGIHKKIIIFMQTISLRILVDRIILVGTSTDGQLQKIFFRIVFVWNPKVNNRSFLELINLESIGPDHIILELFVVYIVEQSGSLSQEIIQNYIVRQYYATSYSGFLRFEKIQLRIPGYYFSEKYFPDLYGLSTMVLTCDTRHERISFCFSLHFLYGILTYR